VGIRNQIPGAEIAAPRQLLERRGAGPQVARQPEGLTARLGVVSVRSVHPVGWIRRSHCAANCQGLGMSLNPQHRHKGDGKAAQHVQGDQPAGDDVLRKPDACHEVRQGDAHDAPLDPLHVSDRTPLGPWSHTRRPPGTAAAWWTIREPGGRGGLPARWVGSGRTAPRAQGADQHWRARTAA
jgi:hypothetical protein